MRFGASPILGLAVSDGGILCAQVAAGAGSGVSVQKVGFFARPTANDLTTPPEEEGRRLASFLKQHGFTARSAVIGVPARWLLSQEKELPPGTDVELKAILRLHAERLTTSDGSPMVADFAGELKGTPGRVLLVALLRSHHDRVAALVEGAGLALLAVTSTALAVAQYVNAASAPLVLLGDTGADVVVTANGTPRVLRHVSLAAHATPGAELRRALTLTGGGTPDSAGVLLADGRGSARGELDDFAAHVRTTVRRASALDVIGTRVEPGALNGTTDGRTIDTYLPGIALAAAGLRRPLPPPVNFARSRLAAPRVSRVGRKALWFGTLAMVPMLGLSVLYLTVRQRESQVVELEAKLNMIAKDVKAAQATVDRVAMGRTFFESRPPVLDGLLDLSLAFEFEEPIWTTSLSLRDDGRGQLQGRATNQQAVLGVVDRLKAGRRFANVQLLDSRDASGRGDEVVFSISFAYAGGR